MNLGRILPEDVASLVHKLHLHSAVNTALGNTPYSRAEALVHELCHAAVFRLNPKPLKSLRRRINARFEAFKRPKASDLSECRAISVERVVFKTLEWDLDWPTFYEIASEDMRVLKDPRTLRSIIELGLDRRTRQRARQVIAWLGQITPPGNQTL